ncbi:hypothetical protein I4U23_016114 [Adineta vaga]|nr:hypothetical protein I4U23_016114 [Adineta vaga]
MSDHIVPSRLEDLPNEILIICLALYDPETFECVLTACSNLKSLDIHGSWGITINHNQSPSYITQAFRAPRSNPDAITYSSLRRLGVMLKGRRDIATDLDNILTLVPNVERLVLLYGTLYEYNVVETFAMIAQRLPYLQRIDCDLSLSLPQHNTSIINYIQQLHASFNQLHIDQAYIFYFLRTYARSASNAPFPFSTVFPQNCVGFTFSGDSVVPLQFSNT